MKEGLKKVDFKQRRVQEQKTEQQLVFESSASVGGVSPSRNTLISEGGNIVGDTYALPIENGTAWQWKSTYQLTKSERNARPLVEEKELKRDQRQAVWYTQKFLRELKRSDNSDL